MTRKGGSRGPPDERKEEEQWKPPEADEPIQRSLDLAIELESDDEEPDFIYGDIVHDEEVEEPIALVVVNIPGLTAEEWELESGDTLADQNEKCPNDDDVIIVVPLEVLENYMPDWDTREAAIPLEKLIDDEVPFAPFPSLQLILVKKSHLRK